MEAPKALHPEWRHARSGKLDVPQKIHKLRKVFVACDTAMRIRTRRDRQDDKSRTKAAAIAIPLAMPHCNTSSMSAIT
jgi:hypothetical protein